MTRRPWTREDKATLRRMARTHRAAPIAKALGRTVCAVYGMAHKLGVRLMKVGELAPRGKYPDSRVRELRQLHGTGHWSPRKLAKRFAMPLGTVQAIVYWQVRA